MIAVTVIVLINESKIKDLDKKINDLIDRTKKLETSAIEECNNVNRIREKMKGRISNNKK